RVGRRWAQGRLLMEAVFFVREKQSAGLLTEAQAAAGTTLTIPNHSPLAHNKVSAFPEKEIHRREQPAVSSYN
ncbi:MAG: hypothetical protein ACI33O_14485, partial [Bhargavaea sp.]